MSASLGQRQVSRISIQELDDVPKSVDDDVYEKPFQVYQAHLSNIMTMGMLLLGFVLTGTLLSVTFTGDESYSSEALTNFVRWAIATAMQATLAIVFAFLVSTRGVYAYTSASAKRGVLAMYNSLILMAITELLMYGSLMCFTWSLSTFIAMMYRGPDICVGMYHPGHRLGSHPSSVRPHSFCGQLGGDLFAAAHSTCGGAQALVGVTVPSDFEALNALTLTKDALWTARPKHAEHFVLCSVYDYYVAVIAAKYKEKKAEGRPYFFIYETDFMPDGARRDSGSGTWLQELISGGSGNFKSAFFLQSLDEVTAAHCEKDEAVALKDRVCGNLNSVAEMPGCATARLSVQSADTCVGELQDDALKCHKVCHGDMVHVDKISIVTTLPFSAFAFMMAVLVVMRMRKIYLHHQDVSDVIRRMGQRREDRCVRACELFCFDDEYDEEMGEEELKATKLGAQGTDESADDSEIEHLNT